jgi:hypothetical protein
MIIDKKITIEQIPEKTRKTYLLGHNLVDKPKQEKAIKCLISPCQLAVCSASSGSTKILISP